MKESQRVLVVEQLSAYLDGQLPETEQQQIEERLSQETKLQELHEGLRKTKLLLSRISRVPAPRSFALTPEMVNVRKRKQKRPFHTTLRWATSLAAMLLVVLFGMEHILGGSLFARSAMPAEQAAESVNALDESTFASEDAGEKGAEPEPLIIWGAPGMGGGGGAAKDWNFTAPISPEEVETVEESSSDEFIHPDGQMDFDFKNNKSLPEIINDWTDSGFQRRLFK